MKKITYIIIVVFIFCGIGAYNLLNNKHTRIEANKTNIVKYTNIATIPNNYTAEMARSKGDVVIVDTHIYNKEKLDTFVNNINKNIPDSLQIVAYTREGDPLIEQLHYDGNVIKLITDNTRDKIALSEQKEINTYEAIDIVKHIKKEGIVYVANLSNGESFDIAYFKEN